MDEDDSRRNLKGDDGFYLFLGMSSERKSNIDDKSKHAFKSALSKSLNQYQLGCERAQMDNWLCFN